MPTNEALLARLQQQFPDVQFEAPAGMMDFTDRGAGGCLVSGRAVPAG